MTPDRKLSTPQRSEPDETVTALLHTVAFRHTPEAMHEPDRIRHAVVVDVSPDGVARVALSGEQVPCEASSLLRFSSSAAAVEALLGRPVLVLVNPSTPPVILGVVSERLWDKRNADVDCAPNGQLPTDRGLSVGVAKRNIDLKASDEIRLTCGKSSLVMRRDGTVVVRGVKIVSRAAESNKIRGGTISLN